MTLTPSRCLQITCPLVAVIGFAPWAFTLSGTVLHAIESEQPLAMSVAAWLVLLVPLWVCWFGLVAWQQRNASIAPALLPAMLMALPALILVGARVF